MLCSCLTNATSRIQAFTSWQLSRYDYSHATIERSKFWKQNISYMYITLISHERMCILYHDCPVRCQSKPVDGPRLCLLLFTQLVQLSVIDKGTCRWAHEYDIIRDTYTAVLQHSTCYWYGPLLSIDCLIFAHCTIRQGAFRHFSIDSVRHSRAFQTSETRGAFNIYWRYWSKNTPNDILLSDLCRVKCRP